MIDTTDSANVKSLQDAPGKRLLNNLDYDVFINLSGAGLGSQDVQRCIETLVCDAGLTGAAGLVTLVMPQGLEPPPRATNLRIVGANLSGLPDALHRAIGGAARSCRHLVVVLDSLLPGNEMLRLLINQFHRDPMFGMVQPRFADMVTDQIWPLPGAAEPDSDGLTLSRAGLSLLPAYTITPELLSGCMVIRREVVREMDRSAVGLASITGELRLLLCQARRRGYRNLLVNRAVLPSQLPPARLYPSPPKADMDRLNQMYPEIARADAWNANLSQGKLEALLARAYADDPTNRRRMLLDCRGMTEQHNGTSHCVLGLLDGFQALDGAWQFDILVSSAAAEFHQLRKRYQKFKLLNRHPEGTYTAGVLLNQPWSLTSVAELHRHALLVAFNMLDTIAWDILYPTNELYLDALWRFVARFSDAIFYNSQFTRDRFRVRFPLQADIAECVTHHSFALEEQVDQAALPQPTSDYILMIGNDYDHKDIRRTARVLADAFPFNKIVAIGIEGVVAHNVLTMPSGQIEETAHHRLIAGARVIVFPSFYEGFGMPVVQALAYGRPVIVRESPLWYEIAERLRSPGQLVPFDNITSLIEMVGSALAGLPLKQLPQGAGLRADESPLRWRDCAQRIISVVEGLMSSVDGMRWQEREEALQALQQMRPQSGS